MPEKPGPEKPGPDQPESGRSGAEPVGGSLADKLNYLFSTVRRPDGQEYSNEQVANSISERGVTISQSYIWQLRKAKKDNPTLKHLQALADFFGVPAAYFFDDDTTDRVAARLAELRTEQQRLTEGSEVRLMAMRAGELSPEGRRQVMDILDLVHRLERAERDKRDTVE